MGLWKTMHARRIKREVSDALSPHSMVLRTIIAGVLLTGGYFMLRKACASDVLFIAIPIIGGGIILGPVLCQLAAAPFGHLFWPKLRNPDQPVYSTATTCRYQGRYEEAISHYRQILLEFPEAFKAHADLIEMTAIDMDDIELSHRFLLQADRMMADESKRRHLHEIYAMAEGRYNAVHTSPERLKFKPLNKDALETQPPVLTGGAHVNTKPEGLL